MNDNLNILFLNCLKICLCFSSCRFTAASSQCRRRSFLSLGNVFPVSSLDVLGVSVLTAEACWTREQFLQSVMRGRAQNVPAEPYSAAPGCLSDPEFVSSTWNCMSNNSACKLARYWLEGWGSIPEFIPSTWTCIGRDTAVSVNWLWAGVSGLDSRVCTWGSVGRDSWLSKLLATGWTVGVRVLILLCLYGT